jgi:hypothetical protein
MSTRSDNYRIKLILVGIASLLVGGLSACAKNDPPPTANLVQVTATGRSSPTISQTAIKTPDPTASPAHTLTVTAAPSPTPRPTKTLKPGAKKTLGRSTNHWPIEAYQFGSGSINLVFVGGIHGGYEWNTILLAYEMIAYFTLNHDAIPPEIGLFIIPAANPDGQVQVVGHIGPFTPDEVGANTVQGRFNGAGVDLNRNWDCNWSAAGQWLDREILTGERPFSEIENQILREFILGLPADGVVFWHSAANGVYPGGCGEPFGPSVELAQVYAESSGYPFEDSFTGYAVTGDSADWLSLVEIPAITIELTNHYDLDIEQNIKAVLAVMQAYSSNGLHSDE